MKKRATWQAQRPPYNGYLPPCDSVVVGRALRLPSCDAKKVERVRPPEPRIEPRPTFAKLKRNEENYGRSCRDTGTRRATRSHAGRVRTDQTDSRTRTEFHRAGNLLGDVERALFL